MQRLDERLLRRLLRAGSLRQPDQPLEAAAPATRNRQFVLVHADRLRGGTIGHGAVGFTHEMDRERAARQQALHGRDVFRLIRRQLFIREDRITKALQLPFDEPPRLLSVVAALGKIDGRLARRLRLAAILLPLLSLALPSASSVLSSCATSHASFATFWL